MPDRNQGTSAARLKPAVILFTLLSFLTLLTWTFSPAVAAAGNGLLSLSADDGGATSKANALAPAVFLPLVIGGIDAPIPFGEVHTGEGTYYDATGAGNCSFDASPDNLMVAAMNHTDYDNAALCGAYVQVTGPKGVVVLRIVDRCPECPAGDVDLSQEAFALIADLADGRVPISWRLVSPLLEGPIVYHFKDGSNQWWTAVQIRNHRNPIVRFEYLSSGGVFEEAPRTDYNYFVESGGMGPGPYTFRVTDVFGQVIVDSGVAHMENSAVAGSAQFPPPP
jgi:expansin (peptidoglycan-binding protein)